MGVPRNHPFWIMLIGFSTTNFWGSPILGNTRHVLGGSVGQAHCTAITKKLQGEKSQQCGTKHILPPWRCLGGRPHGDFTPMSWGTTSRKSWPFHLWRTPKWAIQMSQKQALILTLQHTLETSLWWFPHLYACAWSHSTSLVWYSRYGGFHKWRYPKSSSILDWDFPWLINHPFSGTPIWGNAHMSNSKKLTGYYFRSLGMSENGIQHGTVGSGATVCPDWKVSQLTPPVEDLQQGISPPAPVLFLHIKNPTPVKLLHWISLLKILNKWDQICYPWRNYYTDWKIFNMGSYPPPALNYCIDWYKYWLKIFNKGSKKRDCVKREKNMENKFSKTVTSLWHIWYSMVSKRAASENTCPILPTMETSKS